MILPLGPMIRTPASPRATNDLPFGSKATIMYMRLNRNPKRSSLAAGDAGQAWWTGKSSSLVIEGYLIEIRF